MFAVDISGEHQTWRILCYTPYDRGILVRTEMLKIRKVKYWKVKWANRFHSNEVEQKIRYSFLFVTKMKKMQTTFKLQHLIIIRWTCLCMHSWFFKIYFCPFKIRLHLFSVCCCILSQYDNKTSVRCMAVAFLLQKNFETFFT